MPSLLRKLEDLLNPYKGFFIKYNDILDATNHFHTTNIIQQVEKYNHVYRGKLIRFGTRINVIVEKRLNMTAEELLKLVSMISRFKHKNIATFVGFSYSLDLVYDAIADNCIAYIVSDGEVKESLSQSQNIVHVFSSSYNNFDYVYYKLTCSQRIQICMDAARALSYIHDCDAIHGDFRSTSVLLTEDLEVKVVCLVIIPENSTFSHYTDLDFSVTQKSDVYSFGVVLKDLFCQQYLNPSRSGNTANFRFYFDDDIREQLHSQAFLILSETIDRCLNAQHQRRPNMDETVKLLDKALFLQRRHENPVRQSF
ncbi:receptor-like protein kinase THESEUS 1 [Rutidosis leptorrhynchoides]|uniref:receptor-like protein kinase THESEUS 1 n=1 Tax=Rutidosis leptorrhynchoides TaxID=125765 RepID=UPI003A99A39D